MNYYLITAGLLNSIAAAIHVGCIMFGASWYRFFGAGEHMALLAEQGSFRPTLITTSIVGVLSIWALYAFSAAGLVGKLPLRRPALILVTAIYLMRGVVGFFFIANPIGRTPDFWFWSSAICVLVGAVHLIGLKQQWGAL